MGINRTLLLLLVVGLIIVAFRRRGGETSPGPVHPVEPPSDSRSAAAQTNSTGSPGLVATGHDASR